MVEFQPDDNRFTSGNGTFEPGSIPYLENPGTTIDALPHNRPYFEAHLQFSKNYFERMSDGALDIEYHVLPDVLRLENEMAHYSPVGEDPDLSQLSELTREVWETVAETDIQIPSVQPGDNIAFVIFHAGVGRDIELTGTTLDRTPQDIPSVYLSRQALSNMMDDPSFSGFPIQNGDILVTNSLIIPRTLSRSGEDITGNRFVLPLSINGMLTAQIGSHLGLPDLFNTETGESGIGRFGLMDGAGIFAYNGLFPPEMSAWEKYYLGWSDPITIPSDQENSVTLPAVSQVRTNSSVRINLSSTEYYLIENRHRDPDDEGVIITIQKPDGSTVEQIFSNSNMALTNQESGFDELFEPGVVIDVSNFDFALPGGLDEEGDRELNGGILIWHIDESIIQNRLTRNIGVNSISDQKGVKLIEADGAQDIGRPVSIGLFQNDSNGSPFDFWWSGNNATVITQTESITLYENRFGPDTTPANQSNSGAVSPFELFDFSDNLPNASFGIRPVEPYSDLYQLKTNRSDLDIETFTPGTNNYWTSYPLSLFPIEQDGDQLLIIPGNNGIQNLNIESQDLSSALMDSDSYQQPVYNKIDGFLYTAPNPSTVQEFMPLISIEVVNSQPEVADEFTVPVNRGNLSIAESNIIDLDGTANRFNLETESVESTQNQVIFRTENRGGYSAEVSSQNITLNFPGGSSEFPILAQDDYQKLFLSIIDRENESPFFLLVEGNSLKLFSPENQYSEAYQLYSSSSLNRPAIVDLTNSESHNFLFIDNEENALIGLNKNGAFLDYFPILPPDGVTFTGTPLISDLNGDGALNIMVPGFSESALNLYAYHPNGKPLVGFPLLVGGIQSSNDQIVSPVIFDQYVAAVSPAGDLKVWEFPEMTDISWASAYGNEPNNKSSAFISAGQQQGPDFVLLNKNETYNWPNPAQNNTNIRFQTNGPAEVKIRISTLSGRTIYYRTLQSRGGSAEEISVDTSSWASGGYIALITAEKDGQKESKIVQIAITK
ncbi:T9SS type A sorting domain-containing protein [Rhodohalobacter sp.]|uniref:T9SS-dependent M6-like inactivated metalloprotease n=1 Tax=Rhodohalobacter sp. TaxID=1974210 RepID=UPI002ACED8E7|nr:T9SS type A sorting domain-containing protein [Rhodohalobacter sp.]MDZ7757925.1 T9SS type A sorting domain-containing protein [Rhodohalobacter sp.]